MSGRAFAESILTRSINWGYWSRIAIRLVRCRIQVLARCKSCIRTGLRELRSRTAGLLSGLFIDRAAVLLNNVWHTSKTPNGESLCPMCRMMAEAR
jgi:hypothetical protein